MNDKTRTQIAAVRPSNAQEAHSIANYLANQSEFNRLLDAAKNGDLAAKLTIQKVILNKYPSYSVNADLSLFIENIFSFSNWKDIVTGLHAGTIRLEPRKFRVNSYMKERTVDFTLDNEKPLAGVKDFEGGKLQANCLLTHVRLRKGAYTLVGDESWEGISDEVRRERSRQITPWGPIKDIYENGVLTLKVDSDTKISEMDCSDFNEQNRVDKQQGTLFIGSRGITINEKQKLSLVYALPLDTLSSIPVGTYFQVSLSTICAVQV